MANEKWLKVIDYDAVRDAFDEEYKKTRKLIESGETHLDNLAEGFTEADRVLRKIFNVDAVVLPYPPRPMLKDRNPFNTDVYCPECGTNLSGYYGDEPLPIITCFNCGEILDPYKSTTNTDGERKDGDGNG